MFSRTGLAVVALALGGLSTSARGGPIDAIYAFGDSLTDVGNIFTASGGVEPGAPYVNGQFSNGSVWVQGLAAALGLAPLTPSLLGGTDYAYGSAETGTTPYHTANSADLTGTFGQVNQFLGVDPTADPNALYTIWIGANDLSDIPPGATPAEVAADIGAAVGNIDNAIGALAGAGAKDFLIVTVPDLGVTPAAIAGGAPTEAALSALSAAFDSTLVYGSGPLPSLATIAGADGLDLSVLDTYSLLDSIVANPAIYGFTNVTAPCLTGEVNYSGGTPCAPTQAAQDKYLFWDPIHPTAAGQAIVADAAFNLETPEPGSVSLTATGLLGIALLFRRRRRA